MANNKATATYRESSMQKQHKSMVAATCSMQHKQTHQQQFSAHATTSNNSFVQHRQALVTVTCSRCSVQQQMQGSLMTKAAEEALRRNMMLYQLCAAMICSEYNSLAAFGLYMCCDAVQSIHKASCNSSNLVKRMLPN